MSTIKTKVNEADVYAFIDSFASTQQKKDDSFELIKIMEQFSGFKAKMWGPSMIGFGCYHYKSTRSKQEGDWPILAFSPRKAAISLYVFTGLAKHEYLLEDLGKFKKGVACIYVKKLSDINIEALKQLISVTMDYVKTNYETC